MHHARIQEIFSSIQGEGPWIGERHIFVRFLGCDLRCCYCDTPTAIGSVDDDDQALFTVQIAAGLNNHERVPNPVSPAELTKFCSCLVIAGPSRPTISVTGGEPLLQREFLHDWLPRAREVFKIYLETNGILFDAMKDVRDQVDVVSMDFKLPSSTKLRAFWEEHRRFLSAASGKSIFVKAVVTRDTILDDILTSARLIAEFDAFIPFVIQPAGGAPAPEASALIEFQNAALGIIADVRVIPQAHKILRVR